MTRIRVHLPGDVCHVRPVPRVLLPHMEQTFVFLLQHFAVNERYWLLHCRLVLPVRPLFPRLMTPSLVGIRDKRCLKILLLADRRHTRAFKYRGVRAPALLVVARNGVHLTLQESLAVLLLVGDGEAGRCRGIVIDTAQPIGVPLRVRRNVELAFHCHRSAPIDCTLTLLVVVK